MLSAQVYDVTHTSRRVLGDAALGNADAVRRLHSTGVGFRFSSE
jgi:hypothetical protein